LNSLRSLVASHRLTLGMLLIVTLVLTACGGGAGDSWAGVSSSPDSDVIYVANNKHVIALDATTGERLWAEDYKYQDTQFFAQPVVDNGTVFVGDYDGRMHAIDAATGEQQWVYEPERRMLIGPLSPDPKDRVIGGVAVSADEVFFGLGSRNVVAISRETHQKVWTFETDHGVWGEPLYFDATEEDPATVYVVSLDHHLYAIQADTGDQLWRIDLGGAAPGGMTYDEARNWVYVGTFISEVVAVDLDQHAIVDRFDTSDWVWGRPALRDDTLYVGDLSGNLYAIGINDDSFEELWRLGVADGAIRSTPVVTDSRVIVSSKDKHFYVVEESPDGDFSKNEVWSEKVKDEALTELIYVPPKEEDSADVIVVGTSSSDQLLAAFNLNNREEVWTQAD
jgi:hypothetical protein